jgi:pterin-4a-carbinolamine dehydratase
MSLRVMPEANRIVKAKAKAKAYEYEQDFNSRISELAHELRDYPEWKEVYTKGKRKVAALKFLAEKADSYRLSNDLAEKVSEAAANPPYVSRYWHCGD